MKHLTNYSISQEHEIMSTIHFEHILGEHSSNESMHILNRIQRMISTLDKESMIHILYEVLSQEDNALSLAILNMLGKYGSLLFYQINMYARNNEMFYAYQRDTKRSLNFLFHMNLVEKLRFQITTDQFKDDNGKTKPAKKMKIDAYVLSELGKDLLHHQEGELVSEFLPVLGDDTDKRNFIRCWQIYDFDSLMRQQESFIAGYPEMNKKKIQYHCWLMQSKDKKELAELVIDFPLQGDILSQNEQKLAYVNEELSQEVSSFRPSFINTGSLSPELKDYTVNQYAVFRTSKVPDLTNFKVVNKSYKGQGHPLVLIGNAYDIDGVRYDEKHAGTVVDSYYFYGLKNDKGTLFRIKFTG